MGEVSLRIERVLQQSEHQRETAERPITPSRVEPEGVKLGALQLSVPKVITRLGHSSKFGIQPQHAPASYSIPRKGMCWIALLFGSCDVSVGLSYGC